ncbi:MAG TPA: DUF5658 family protein [Gemmataceae bacterium]|nr:DUF5658 family protein [Gemmataceae bacterium]
MNHKAASERESSAAWGKSLRRWLLILYLVLSVADLFLTWLLVQDSDHEVYESNPFAGAWLTRFGWSGLLIFKAILVISVAILCLAIARSRPRWSLLVLVLGCAVTGGVVVYSWTLLGRLGMLRQMW